MQLPESRNGSDWSVSLFFNVAIILNVENDQCSQNKEKLEKYMYIKIPDYPKNNPNNGSGFQNGLSVGL